VPGLVADREKGLLTRGVVGLHKAGRELEPRCACVIERDMPRQIPRAQAEIAVGQRIGGHRRAVHQAAYRQTTCDEEESRELKGQSQLQ
jgi:hypothetical protein